MKRLITSHQNNKFDTDKHSTVWIRNVQFLFRAGAADGVGFEQLDGTYGVFCYHTTRLNEDEFYDYTVYIFPN